MYYVTSLTEKCQLMNIFEHARFARNSFSFISDLVTSSKQNSSALQELYSDVKTNYHIHETTALDMGENSKEFIVVSSPLCKPLSLPADTYAEKIRRTSFRVRRTALLEHPPPLHYRNSLTQQRLNGTLTIFNKIINFS